MAPILLRDDEKYFAEEITLDGSKFKVREIDDEALKLALERQQAIQVALGIPATGLTVESAAELEAAVNLKPPNEKMGHKQALLEFVDGLVGAGLVEWDLKNSGGEVIEFTPEKSTLLPNWVKNTLSARILNHSLMSVSDVDFTP